MRLSPSDSSENEKTLNTGAYIPFGQGPHIVGAGFCSGRAYHVPADKRLALNYFPVRPLPAAR